MTEPVVILGAFCLSLIILFVLALFFALVLCRAAAEADIDATHLSASRRPPSNDKPLFRKETRR